MELVTLLSICAVEAQNRPTRTTQRRGPPVDDYDRADRL
jgi:hypothetical protein